MKGVNTKNEGKVFPISEKQKNKIKYLRNKTWSDNGKQFGPMSDTQIRYALKLNEATVKSVK